MQKNSKKRQPTTEEPKSSHDIEALLSRLMPLTLEELKKAWKQRFSRDAPVVRSRDFLLRLFAWKIQADALGGLGALAQNRLSNIAAALHADASFEPKIRRNIGAGLILTREWKGTTHTVKATNNGFEHLGRHYKSLSDIARRITGTRWSGPRFFGLERKAEPVSRRTIP